ncbi:MAG: TlpA disulfide reductase family protein [Rhodothermus sp.]|nr:TlpA disulfide reductase family protein [Rhodothermus sp.]
MQESLPISPSLLYVLAGVLTVGGLVLIWLAPRLSPDRRLKGAAAWSGALFGGVIVLSGLALGLLAYLRQQQPEIVQSPGVVGRPAPELTFRLVETDEPRTLSAYRGQVILLNLWATWCPPCLAEIPELNRFQQVYRDQGVVVIMISDEPRQTILEFMKKRPLEAVSGYLPEDTRWPWPYNRVEQARPTTFVIDRDGIIRETWPGAANFSQFEAAVLPYLE